MASRLLPASLAQGRASPEPGFSPPEGELPGVRERGLGSWQVGTEREADVAHGLVCRFPSQASFMVFWPHLAVLRKEN